MKPIHVTVGGGDVKAVTFGNDQPFALIAGPCVMESRDHAFGMAESLAEMSDKLGIGLIFKTSFDKANRTSIKSVRGMGMDKSLAVFREIREKVGVPTVTDVHLPEQCAPIADVVDLLQIPAFLCRQTDLLMAAAETGKPLNIKKGQFLAPWDMVNVAAKVESMGSQNIMLCERGASFGYNTLVSDMRSLPIMRATGYPVIFDATHSVQQPGGAGTTSGGKRQFVPTLARAAVAAGVAGLFIETHEDPENAPSDGPNMVYFEHLPSLVRILMEFDKVSKEYPEIVEI
ncbi:MAG: 3-deoxy-8-phosphooctulonate synthase [Alphaproteobacteria bacterium]